MMSFVAILKEGECLAASAEAAWQEQIEEAFASYRARQEARRAARIAEGWDLALAGFAQAAPDEKDDADDAEDPDRRPIQPRPRRRRRRGRDRVSPAPRNEAPDMTAPALTSMEQGWDRALREAAAPDAPDSAAAERGSGLLSRLWLAMFPVG